MNIYDTAGNWLGVDIAQPGDPYAAPEDDDDTIPDEEVNND